MTHTVQSIFVLLVTHVSLLDMGLTTFDCSVTQYS